MGQTVEMKLVEDTVAFSDAEMTMRVWNMLESTQAQVQLIREGRLPGQLRQLARQHRQGPVRKAFAQRTDLTDAERREIIDTETRSDVISATLNADVSTDLLQQLALRGKTSIVDKVARLVETRNLMEHPQLAAAIYSRISTAKGGEAWHRYSSIFNTLASWSAEELAQYDFPLDHPGLCDAATRNYHTWRYASVIDRYLDAVLTRPDRSGYASAAAETLKLARAHLPQVEVTENHLRKVQDFVKKTSESGDAASEVTWGGLIREMELAMSGHGDPKRQTVEQARQLGTLNSVLVYRWDNGETFDHLLEQVTADEIVQASEDMVKGSSARATELLTHMMRPDFMEASTFGDNVWGHIAESSWALPGYQPTEILNQMYRHCPPETFNLLVNGKLPPASTWTVRNLLTRTVRDFRTVPDQVRRDIPAIAFTYETGTPSGLYQWLFTQAPQDRDAARVFLSTVNSLLPTWSGTLGELIDTTLTLT